MAGPLPQTPRIPPLLLPGPDGESAFEIACLESDGQELVIRHVRTDEKRQINVVRERHVKLEAPLYGTPVVLRCGAAAASRWPTAICAASLAVEAGR